MSESESIRDTADGLTDRQRKRMEDLLSNSSDFVDLIPDSSIRAFASEIVTRIYSKQYIGPRLTLFNVQSYVESWARMFAERDVE